ncbi:MAG: DUF3800 domain-containing protein [Kouleothrix sp.]
MQADLDKQTPNHVAYADETLHNTGRFRGLALITVASKNAERIILEVRQLLQVSSISEFKWSKLRSARERFAALHMLDYMLEKARTNLLRVDVITWDVEDSRHKIQGRSDIRNLRRMYYFLFKDVLGKRWPVEAIWQIYPDESSTNPWSHLGYLTEVWDWNTHEMIFEVNLSDIVPSESHEEPLLQVADLFAGLAAYSRNSYETYEKWTLLSKEEKDAGKVPNEFSKADLERCRILQHFDEQCKNLKLGVSLKQKRGLRTFNPARPVNFWWYEPQNEDDLAPIWH